MVATSSVDFQVRRSELRTCRVVSAELEPLAPGQVRIEVDAFAFTSNNVSYAAAGDG